MNELNRALHRIASQTTPSADAAAAVRRRAGRLRRRRRATTAAMGAAAVALVVPVAIALLPPGGRDTGVTTVTTRQATATPTSTQPGERKRTQATKAPDGALQTTVDFSKFSRGKAPAVPWYHDGVIHDGDREVPFEGGFPYLNSLQQVRGGYLVLADHKDIQTTNEELFFVDSTGERRSLARVRDDGLIRGTAVSDDGGQFAWSTTRGTLSDSITTLNIADGATGEVIQTKQIRGGNATPVSPAAFVGPEVVLNRATNKASKPIKIWDPEANTVRDWYDASSLAGLDAGQTLAAVTLLHEPDQTCTAVIELPEQRRRWQACGKQTGSFAVFSPDGRYVASVNHGAVHLLTARSGEPVLRISGTAPLDLAWEPGGDLVFVAEDAKTHHYAIVRCSPAGECELATEPKPRSNGRWPYQIGIRR